jgi:outer membrane protein assembly factor BamA
VDAGNVWTFSDAKKSLEYDILGDGVGKKFDASKFLTDFAVGVGVGIRYDLDFFVLRIDWGFVVHDPRYDSKSGYFNFPRFSKGQCLNFAIGYPF